MRKLLRDTISIEGRREKMLEGVCISRKNHADAASKFWQDFKGPLTPAGKKAHARIVRSAASKAKAAERRLVRAVRTKMKLRRSRGLADRSPRKIPPAE